MYYYFPSSVLLLCYKDNNRDLECLEVLRTLNCLIVIIPTSEVIWRQSLFSLFICLRVTPIYSRFEMFLLIQCEYRTRRVVFRLVCKKKLCVTLWVVLSSNNNNI